MHTSNVVELCPGGTLGFAVVVCMQCYVSLLVPYLFLVQKSSISCMPCDLGSRLFKGTTMESCNCFVSSNITELVIMNDDDGQVCTRRLLGVYHSLSITIYV